MTASRGPVHAPKLDVRGRIADKRGPGNPRRGRLRRGEPRRRVELGLLLLAVAFTAGAYTLAVLGETASIPANIGPFLVVVVALLALAHVAVRQLAPRATPIFLPVAGLLNGLGYVFIARLGDGDRLAGLQATWTAVGIAAFVATLFAVRRLRSLEAYRYIFGFAGIGLLLLPLVPFLGREINGARIWVSLGPVNFQPGEFAKVALAIFVAAYLVENRELLQISTFRLGPLSTPDPRHLGPLLLAIGASLLVMVAERDLGSSLLFFGLFVIMVWVATGRALYPVTMIALFAIGVLIAYRTFGHVRVRFDTWLNPWDDRFGAGNQVIESWFALAWGGVTGSGPGLGEPDRIPAAETDFIFSVIGEELGLFGSTALLISYLLLMGSGFQVAMRSTVPFDKLLAVGLTSLIAVQSFIIIAGVIRVLPLTGVTLPFVSYGGSSLVANYVLLALLIRISHETNERSQRAPGGGQ